LATLHYASGGGPDSQGNFAPAQAGFNLADVSYVDQLNQLPDGVQGLVWLDQYNGVTQDFIDQVTPFIGNPNLYGFYLVDEPDPTGVWGVQASPADLMAESDWIHSHVPGAQTFTVLMNMGSAENPDYSNTYNSENTHIDQFGLDYYPVWSDRTLDFNNIDKYVAAAHDAGISTDQIVPVYQTFGGGSWITEDGSHHQMPTAAQEQQMLDEWASVVPNPAFDYAFAWASQAGDTALESSPELQQVFLQHNTSGSAPPAGGTGGSTPPVTDPSGSTPPPTDTSGSTPPTDSTGGSVPPTHNAGGSTPPADSTGGSTPPAHGTGGDTTTGSPSAGGSPSDPTTSPTSDHGGWWHRGGSDFSQNHGGLDLSHNHGGLDFSQLSGGGSSWLADRFASNAPSTSTANMDVSTVADTTPNFATDASHLANFDHNDHHAAWHW
jgi:hypothetical protein